MCELHGVEEGSAIGELVVAGLLEFEKQLVEAFGGGILEVLFLGVAIRKNAPVQTLCQCFALS